jgi:hypothetical protein
MELYYNYVLTEILCDLTRCKNAQIPTQTKYNDFSLSKLQQMQHLDHNVSAPWYLSTT